MILTGAYFSAIQVILNSDLPRRKVTIGSALSTVASASSNTPNWKKCEFHGSANFMVDCSNHANIITNKQIRPFNTFDYSICHLISDSHLNSEGRIFEFKTAI